MVILHYALGLFPYRSGGLTRYVNDLMIAQVKRGHSISLLYPGNMKVWTSKIEIRKDMSFLDINVYELRNPLPVSLFYGVRNPSAFMNSRDIDKKAFDLFLHEVNPDIMHVHTLMGLPLEYLQIAKKNGVKVVYTSHDYFGLCLKVNFINSSGNSCETPCGKICALCNASAPSTNFIKIRNLKILTCLKKYIK